MYPVFSGTGERTSNKRPLPYLESRQRDLPALGPQTGMPLLDIFKNSKIKKNFEGPAPIILKFGKWGRAFAFLYL
jgi:hypothetical protein